MAKYDLQPISLEEANQFVCKYHRHHGKVQGHKFSIALNNGQQVIGVAIIGRPVSRMLDNGWTLEVTRLCVIEGYKDACSMLYAAAWRAVRALGYKRLITYILKSETGVSLQAANWRLIGEAGGGTWDRKDRPRFDKHPTETKLLFEIAARRCSQEVMELKI